MKCDYKGCTCDFEPLLGVIDDGKVRFAICPNHHAFYGIEGRTDDIDIHEKSALHDPVGKCNICSAPALQFVDGEEVEFRLCEPHLRKLFLLHLSPLEFKVLYEKYGNVFLLHDDFYDPITGVALQPVR